MTALVPVAVSLPRQCRIDQMELRDLGVSALRFFVTHAVDRPDLARKLVRTGHVRKLPVVLRQHEVARLTASGTRRRRRSSMARVCAQPRASR